MQQAVLLLTAFPFCLKFHPRCFCYGSPFFLTAPLNANYGTRIRYLGLSYCVHVEPKLLRTILVKCPNLVVLDLTGIVRESQEMMTTLRTTDKEQELLMRRDKAVTRLGRALYEDRDPDVNKQWRNQKDIDTFLWGWVVVDVVDRRINYNCTHTGLTRDDQNFI